MYYVRREGGRGGTDHFAPWNTHMPLASFGKSTNLVTSDRCNHFSEVLQECLGSPLGEMCVYVMGGGGGGGGGWGQ